MRFFRIQFTITHALILSLLVHFFVISPSNKLLFRFEMNKTSPPEELTNVEFEFFQAKEREQKQVFIPQGMPEAVPDKTQDPAELVATEEGIPISNPTLQSHDQGIQWDESSEQDQLTPSLEEQKAIPTHEEKTTDSLESQVDLEESKATEKVKWDYCNRIRTLIENNAKLPENLKRTEVTDVVKIEITLNREGKLIKDTPKILDYAVSRYPELNQAALEAVRIASSYFPPIPERYKKDEITFELPIKFIAGQDQK